MTTPARPELICVWERLFALEDSADDFYEVSMEKYESPLEVDRFDAHRVRVYLNCKALESAAQAVEAKHNPLGMDTPCTCGHALMAHEEADSFHCTVKDCGCQGYERDDPGGFK